MRPSGSRAAHKLACLRPIAAADGLSDAERFLLFNCVETYLELDPEEAAEHEALRAAEGNREVRDMAMTWADKKIAEGWRRAKIERAEGRPGLGREAGIREVVLRQFGLRFGPLPEEARRRVEAISSPDALARLADQVLVARSLEEMGLA